MKRESPITHYLIVQHVALCLAQLLLALFSLRNPLPEINLFHHGPPQVMQAPILFCETYQREKRGFLMPMQWV